MEENKNQKKVEELNETELTGAAGGTEMETYSLQYLFLCDGCKHTITEIHDSRPLTAPRCPHCGLPMMLVDERQVRVCG